MMEGKLFRLGLEDRHTKGSVLVYAVDTGKVLIFELTKGVIDKINTRVAWRAPKERIYLLRVTTGRPAVAGRTGPASTSSSES
jgi:hypothetical protein